MFSTSPTLTLPHQKGKLQLPRERGQQEPMRTLCIQRIGSQASLILPEELLTHLGGEQVIAIETPYGVKLLPYDSELFTQLQEAEVVMAEDAEVLRRLAG